jgi:hypothetical protein
MPIVSVRPLGWIFKQLKSDILDQSSSLTGLHDTFHLELRIMETDSWTLTLFQIEHFRSHTLCWSRIAEVDQRITDEKCLLKAVTFVTAIN